MADCSTEEDSFDSIVFIEDRVYDDGFKTGYSEGVKKGHHDGYESGYEKGKQIGEEIGFYLGFAETWMTLLNDKNEENTKIFRLVNGFHESILIFNIMSIHEDNYFSQIQLIRSKYKQITSLLKISTEFHDKSSFNF